MHLLADGSRLLAGSNGRKDADKANAQGNGMKISAASSNTAPIVLIYGHEGRGKTTLACKAPNPVALLLERGLPKGVIVDAFEDVGSFDDVMAVLRDLYTDPQDYRSLIIDTVDSLEALVTEYTCRKNGWKSIEQPAFGKGWVAVDDEWRRFIRAITAIRHKHGVIVIMLCHADVTRVDDPRAPTYTSYAPRLHRRGRGLVMDACDIVGFLGEDLRIQTDNNDRVRASANPMRHLFVEGSPAFSAKTRFAMPAKIAIPLDFDFADLAQYWA
jgi:hypothetical protein